MWNVHVAPGSGSVTFSWNARPEIAGIAGYYAICDSSHRYVQKELLDGAATTLTLTGLDPDDVCTCKLSVEEFIPNGHGDRVFFQTTQLSTKTLPDLPGPISNPFLVAHQRGVTLTWGSSAGATSYVISRGEGDPAQSFKEVARIGPATNWTDTGLEGWTLYAYRIRGLNEAGSGWEAETRSIETFGDPSVVNLGPVAFAPIPVNSTSVPGQSFVASASGALMGVEVSVTETGSVAGRSDDLIVLLYDRVGFLGVGSKAPGGRFYVPPSPVGGSPGALQANEVGTGYYDFSRSGIQLVEGAQYAFEITNCTGRLCNVDDDFEVGLLALTNDVYPGGTAFQNGTEIAGDLAFKVYVRPE